MRKSAKHPIALFILLILIWIGLFFLLKPRRSETPFGYTSSDILYSYKASSAYTSFSMIVRSDGTLPNYSYSEGFSRFCSDIQQIGKSYSMVEDSAEAIAGLRNGEAHQWKYRYTIPFPVNFTRKASN